MSIPLSKFYQAESVSGCNICLWGKPKLLIICGSCYKPFETRTYYPITNMENELAAICPSCNQYNKLGLYEK